MTTIFVIFLITYLFIGLRQTPRILRHRPAGALVGPVLIAVAGVLTLEQAFAAVDLHTIFLPFRIPCLLIGLVVSFIVAQKTRKCDEIGFVEHFRVGAFVSVITIVVGILVLVIEVRIAGSAEQAASVQPAGELTVSVKPARPEGLPKTFNVVLLCETPEQQWQGLQGFRRLAADEAALFSYTIPSDVTFWMGSVSYPIDIIFVSPDMTVSRVYPHCRPGQGTRYPSGRPIIWVIETAAGSGIRPGDVVTIRGAGASGGKSGKGR